MISQKKDFKLSRINKKKIEMTEIAYKMVSLSVQYIKKNDKGVTEKTIAKTEKELDIKEKKLDAECMMLLATENLMAKPLRQVAMTLKMSAELERIGDLAHSIVMCTAHYYELENENSIEIVKKIGETTLSLFKKTMDCIKKKTSDEARKIRALDREINESKRFIIPKIIRKLQGDSLKGFSCYELMLIAQKYERIGDLCKNLAEEVIYGESGDDIKHEPT